MAAEKGYGPEYWDGLFSARERRLPHEAAIDDFIDGMGRGRLLDLGCGDGRNAFYFASHGFEVVGLDYSRAGLAKIERRAAEEGLAVRAAYGDLEEGAPGMEGSFDAACFIHAPVGPRSLAFAVAALREGGALLVISFLRGTVDPSSARHSVGLDEVAVSSIGRELTIVKRADYADERGCLVGILAQKRPRA